jgi:hypothetical protein
LSNLQSEVFEAFRAIDIPEDKALKAATALSRRDDDVTSLKRDLAVLKWMVGSLIGLSIIIVGSMFTLWSRLGEISGQVALIARAIPK